MVNLKVITSMEINSTYSTFYIIKLASFTYPAKKYIIRIMLLI